jgi:parvulin-like peptidyl-prolyl isomerase
MNSKTPFLFSLWLACAALPVQSAPDPFGNEVLVRGNQIEIRRGLLDRAFLQFKANADLRGQPIPDARREELEAALLDRLIVTRLLMHRANEQDRQAGKTEADKFVANVINEAGSEAAFQRQLAALAFTREEFETQVLERAICEEVVERVLTSKAQVTDDQVKQYYQDHAAELRRPEMVRASHILLSTRDATGNQLSDVKKTEKFILATNVLARARKGEDFAALAKEFSEDPGSKDKGGEYTFPRGQMAPEFEAAAFSLQTNQISDIVTTTFGYHIIRLIQRIPSEPIEFGGIAEDIRKKLIQEQVQERLLPKHLQELKQSAKLEYLNGARPPVEPVDGAGRPPPG